MCSVVFTPDVFAGEVRVDLCGCDVFRVRATLGRVSAPRRPSTGVRRKLCLSMCGLILRVMPAAAVTFLSCSHRPCRVILLPRALRNIASRSWYLPSFGASDCKVVTESDHRIVVERN